MEDWDDFTKRTRKALALADTLVYGPLQRNEWGMEAADIGRPSRHTHDDTNDPTAVHDTSHYHNGDVLGRSAVIDDWCNDEVWAILDQNRRVVYAQRRSATSGTFLRPASSRNSTAHGVPWVHWDPGYSKVI